MQIIVSMSEQLMIPPHNNNNVQVPQVPHVPSSNNTIVINIPPAPYGYHQVVRLDVVPTPVLASTDALNPQNNPAAEETESHSYAEKEESSTTTALQDVEEEVAFSDGRSALSENFKEGINRKEQNVPEVGASFAKDMLAFLDAEDAAEEAKEKSKLILLPTSSPSSRLERLEEGETLSLSTPPPGAIEEEDDSSGRKRIAMDTSDVREPSRKKGRSNETETKTTTTTTQMHRGFDNDFDVLVEKGCVATIAYEKAGYAERFLQHYEMGSMYVSYRSKEYGKRIIQLRRRFFTTRDWNSLKDNTSITFDLYKEKRGSKLVGRCIQCN